MKSHRICPFCNAIFNRYPIVDLKCKCGAEYHRQMDIWSLYEGKERKEVKGDLWNVKRL